MPRVTKGNAAIEVKCDGNSNSPAVCAEIADNIAGSCNGTVSNTTNCPATEPLLKINQCDLTCTASDPVTGISGGCSDSGNVSGYNCSHLNDSNSSLFFNCASRQINQYCYPPPAGWTRSDSIVIGATEGSLVFLMGVLGALWCKRRKNRQQDYTHVRDEAPPGTYGSVQQHRPK